MVLLAVCYRGYPRGGNGQVRCQRQVREEDLTACFIPAWNQRIWCNCAAGRSNYISESHSFKLLGLYISEDMSRALHIAAITEKAHQPMLLFPLKCEDVQEFSKYSIKPLLVKGVEHTDWLLQSLDHNSNIQVKIRLQKMMLIAWTIASIDFPPSKGVTANAA